NEARGVPRSGAKAGIAIPVFSGATGGGLRGACHRFLSGTGEEHCAVRVRRGAAHPVRRAKGRVCGDSSIFRERAEELAAQEVSRHGGEAGTSDAGEVVRGRGGSAARGGGADRRFVGTGALAGASAAVRGERLG